MQRKPIAVSEPDAGSVRGLGVCDALEVPVEPRQLMWLIDQLEDMQRPLERIVERECEASTRSAGEKNDSSQDPAYELALLQAMRARLPGSPVRRARSIRRTERACPYRCAGRNDDRHRGAE
jgi:hypothetical protein